MSERRRKGYVGAYIGDDLKRELQTAARQEHRTLSMELMHLVDAHVTGRDAERDACAKAVCSRCRDELPEWDERREFFYHTDSTVCPASRIHERGLERAP